MKIKAKMKQVNKPKVIVPPIKSQGIKTKLVPLIMELVRASNVTGKWIEPFMGTGVVGFNAKFNKALLNDINPHLIKFYNAVKEGKITPGTVKNYLEKEGRKLAVADNDGYDHYRFVRARFNAEFDPLDFLFVNRAGFNGMIRFSKKGHWNIPFCKKPNRFARSYVTKISNQVKKVGEVIKKDWQFTTGHFEEAINLASENDLIYCDPPYLGRYVDYYSGWTEKDEDKLFNLLDNTQAKFILSTWSHNEHRHNEMLDKYWSKFNILTREHFYHSGGKIENRQGITEALIFNFDIKPNEPQERIATSITKGSQLRMQLT